MFTPKIGEDERILTNIFKRGWFNQQLENDLEFGKFGRFADSLRWRGFSVVPVDT